MRHEPRAAYPVRSSADAARQMENLPARAAWPSTCSQPSRSVLLAIGSTYRTHGATRALREARLRAASRFLKPICVCRSCTGALQAPHRPSTTHVSMRRDQRLSTSSLWWLVRMPARWPAQRKPRGRVRSLAHRVPVSTNARVESMLIRVQCGTVIVAHALFGDARDAGGRRGGGGAIGPSIVCLHGC